MAKKGWKLFIDWRFILVFVVLVGGLVSVVLWGGNVSPIDKHMQGKQGGGISSIFSGGGGGGFGNAPEGSYEVAGSKGATHFAWVDAQYLQSKTTLRAIGSTICGEQNTKDYCEIYFWTVKDEISVKLPVNRDYVVAYYEVKNGSVKLKLFE